MKYRKIAPILLLLVLAAACNKQVVKAPVPGSLNTFDATTYRVLADTQAALNSFSSDIKSGTFHPSPAFKTALNQAIVDYNTANSLWQQYHASGGATPQAPITAAANKAQNDVTTLGGLK